MSTRFLQTQNLRLTPLTPIHIGCGIDFEPTNYVIDAGTLFHFEPSQVPLLPADHKALLDAVNAGPTALRRVQAFFYERRQRYSAYAQQVVAVAAGVEQQYAQRIGQIAQRENNGFNVNNQLEIERSAHHPHSGMLYLPGSSLKGAMRTAWLDAINQGAPLPYQETAQAMEKRLLQGAFHTDPLRLLHVQDAIGSQVLSKVYFCTNQKKKQVSKNGQELGGQGPSTRKETIMGGQYAALYSEWRLDLLPGQTLGTKVPAEHQRFSFSDLAGACNRYYLPRLRDLLRALEERSFVNYSWLLELRRLLSALEPAMARNEVFLLRVGRHSGAESVTLDGVRNIRIMQGRGQPAKFSSEGATTVWLAAEHEAGPRTDMLPFGWLLVELDSVPAQTAMQQWCEQQPKPDLTNVREQLARARVRISTESAEAAKVLLQQAEQQAAAHKAAEEKAAQLAALTPHLREVATLEQALQARTQALRGSKDKPNTTLHSQARQLAKRALNEAWPLAEREALATMLEQQLPACIQLDWKDERKKLQLAQLKLA
jgi:CRISPR-associated protein Csm5